MNGRRFDATLVQQVQHHEEMLQDLRRIIIGDVDPKTGKAVKGVVARMERIEAILEDCTNVLRQGLKLGARGLWALGTLVVVSLYHLYIAAHVQEIPNGFSVRPQNAQIYPDAPRRRR